MARCIVKIRDRYLDWSTVVDAPVSGGMTLEQLRAYYSAEYGSDEMLHFARIVALADQQSASADCNWQRRNRAGPEETCLSEDELYRVYCLGETLDDATVQRKFAEKQAENSHSERLAHRLSDKPTVAEIRAVFDSLALGASLNTVESLLGSPTDGPRQKGAIARAKWVFEELVIECYFDRSTSKLAGRQLTPNYGKNR